MRLLTITFAAWAGFAGLAHASDCAFTPAPATRLQSTAAVADYQPVLKACVAADGRKAVAIREMAIAGQKIALLADPEALTTRLERATCWTCHDESEDELAATRMGRAIREMDMEMLDVSALEQFGKVKGIARALDRFVAPAIFFFMKIDKRGRPMAPRLCIFLPHPKDLLRRRVTHGGS